MADLGVYSSIGVRSAADELFRRFEQARACRLAVIWSTAPMLVARIEAGEAADVLILSRAGIARCAKQERLRQVLTLRLPALALPSQSRLVRPSLTFQLLKRSRQRC